MRILRDVYDFAWAAPFFVIVCVYETSIANSAELIEFIMSISCYVLLFKTTIVKLGVRKETKEG